MASEATLTPGDLGALLASHERIALASHLRPDGDAIGSLIGLGEALKAIGKDVFLLNQDGVPNRYEFLGGTEAILRPLDLEEVGEIDLLVALDTGNAARIGDSVWEFTKSRKQCIVIDHHVSNERYGDVNYVDDQSPATGQIVYEIIKAMDWPLTDNARDAIWIAIVTDTGSWQYQNTTARTFEIGADLMRAGVDVAALSTRIYQSYPLRRLKLMRALLNEMKLTSGERVASWAMGPNTLSDLGATSEDTEGLIDYLRAIDSVIVAVTFEETRDGSIRISARSKSNDVDVSEICGQFGGGGHRLAAGARAEGTLEEVSSQFLKTVNEVLENGNR